MIQSLVRYKGYHYFPSMGLLSNCCKDFLYLCGFMTSLSSLSSACTCEKWFTDPSGYLHIGAWRVLASPNFLSWLCAHRKNWMCYIHLHRVLFQLKGHKQLNLLHLPSYLTWYHKNVTCWKATKRLKFISYLSCRLMLLSLWQQLLVMSCTHTKQFPDKAFPWCSL